MVNEFEFLNTPKFNYEYKNEVNVLGRKLVHIGEGIFMFEEPFVSDALSLDQFIEKLEDYKDISFIRFYTYSYNEEDNVRSLLDNNDRDKKKWIIPFAISRTHRRHSAESIRDYVREYMAGFPISDSMMGIIKNIVENYMENDNAHHSSYEEIYYNYKEHIYEHKPAADECTHLLDFAHNSEDGKYVFVSGFAGRKILDGIYYFDDSVSADDDKGIGNRIKGSDGYFDRYIHRICSDDLDPGDFEENIAFVGKAIWSGFSIMAYEGSSIYYMAFGDSAIDVLYRLYKNLSGYEMRGMKKDAVEVKIEPVDLIAGLEEYMKKESSRPSINIPEGACELVEGMGFHNLDVRCKLLFQDTGIKDTTNDRGFSKYDVAYIMDDKLYLINYNVNQEREEGYALSLRMIKELSVRYKAILFDHVKEDIFQLIIDNRDAEKSLLGEEDYSSYLKFVTEKRNG